MIGYDLVHQTSDGSVAVYMTNWNRNDEDISNYDATGNYLYFNRGGTGYLAIQSTVADNFIELSITSDTRSVTLTTSTYFQDTAYIPFSNICASLLGSNQDSVVLFSVTASSVSAASTFNVRLIEADPTEYPVLPDTIWASSSQLAILSFRCMRDVVIGQNGRETTAEAFESWTRTAPFVLKYNGMVRDSAVQVNPCLVQLYWTCRDIGTPKYYAFRLKANSNQEVEERTEYIQYGYRNVEISKKPAETWTVFQNLSYRDWLYIKSLAYSESIEIVTMTGSIAVTVEEMDDWTVGANERQTINITLRAL